LVQADSKNDRYAPMAVHDWKTSSMNAVAKSALFVGAFPGPAALERYVSGDLALRLESLGWSVQVTSRSPGRFGRAWQIVWGALRVGRRHSAACVDLYSGPAFYWAEWACQILRRLRTPVVLILRGGDLPEFGRRHPGRVKRLLSLAAAVTCPSHYLLEEMRPLRQDLMLLPNPLDVSKYSYRESQPPLRRLGWLRAFHDIYNPELAVQALGRIRKDNDDVCLTMMGPDKGDQSLQRTRRMTRSLGLEAAVAFTGAVAKRDVPGRLSQADIFLNTSNFDNTPVSVLEALACGLPVVSTNVGGIPYLLEDGRTALLVPPADAEAMSGAVTRLLRQPDLAANLSRNGLQLVKMFDWTVVLPRWEKLLEGVAAGRPGANRGQAKVATPLSGSFSASR
jgi:glycosyltransferase involved in cell wall biosynthesis